MNENQEKKSDPAWQSGWEGWEDDEWKDPNKAVLTPIAVVEESSLKHVSVKSSASLDETDTEAYETAVEYETDTGNKTDNDYFSANEEVSQATDIITPTGSGRNSPIPKPDNVAEKPVSKEPITSEESVIIVECLKMDQSETPEETESLESVITVEQNIDQSNRVVESVTIVEKEIDQSESLVESVTIVEEEINQLESEVKSVTIVEQNIYQSESAEKTDYQFRDGCTIIEVSNKKVLEVFDPSGQFKMLTSTLKFHSIMALCVLL